MAISRFVKLAIKKNGLPMITHFFNFSGKNQPIAILLNEDIFNPLTVFSSN
jgi:hypothetical protein